jgi:hypothetical protein
LAAADEVELLAILKGKRAGIPLSEEHIRQAGKATKAIPLKSIRNAENVNALAPKQTLSFGEKGMTIPSPSARPASTTTAEGTCNLMLRLAYPWERRNTTSQEEKRSWVTHAAARSVQPSVALTRVRQLLP